MALTVQRTGAQSFTVAQDDPSEPLVEITADYSTTPPTLIATMRFINAPNETWADIDELLTTNFGV